MTLEIFDIAPVPLYDEDVELAGFPTSVQAFRERIAAADALLIATPEYNYSIPGVLKNAIDWAPRSPDPPLAKKPEVIVSVAQNKIDTAGRLTDEKTREAVRGLLEVLFPAQP